MSHARSCRGPRVLERILPASVAVVSRSEDVDGAELFPEERAALGQAVGKRRREFVTARACAREALGQLGLAAQAVPSGARGEPLWPQGIVGSITHCEGYRACALARSTDLLTIGVDAEPNQPLPDGVLGDVALAEEREWIRSLAGEAPEVSWDRLLFSAKESVYKAWFPLAQRWLGFEDASLQVDRGSGTFSARLLVPGPRLGEHELRGFRGRWQVADGLVLTAIAIGRGDAE